MAMYKSVKQIAYPIPVTIVTSANGGKIVTGMRSKNKERENEINCF